MVLVPSQNVFPDGQRFLMIKEEQQSAAQIQIVFHWFEELERLGVCAAERFLAIATTTYCGCSALRIDMEYRIFSAAQAPSPDYS